MRNEQNLDQRLLLLADVGLHPGEGAGSDTACRVRLQAAIDGERGRRRDRTGRRKAGLTHVVAAVCALVLAAGATYTVPATRAAVDDVYGVIADWAAGDLQAGPGRQATQGDIPSWMRTPADRVRVVAEVGGEQLLVSVDGDRLDIELGHEVGFNAEVSSLRKQFADHRVVWLGPGYFSHAPKAGDPVALFGLTSRRVTRVVLRFASGPPAAQDDLDGGFALKVDSTRPLRSLTGYDATGSAVEHLDISAYDLSICNSDCVRHTRSSGGT